MGDRVSISFKKGNIESIALFDHWGGMERVEEARIYAANLKKVMEGKSSMPLERLEPTTIMVDFIRHITRDMVLVEGTLYVGQMRNPMAGDNSDNGHHVVNLD